MDAVDEGRRWTSRYQPSVDEVLDLIARAERHELGVDFLQRGAQDAVAATFEVHAFVVDAARRRLGRQLPGA